MNCVYRKQVKTIPELRRGVEEFASSVPQEHLRRMVRPTRKIVVLCIGQKDGVFEHLPHYMFILIEFQTLLNNN